MKRSQEADQNTLQLELRQGDQVWRVTSAASVVEHAKYTTMDGKNKMIIGIPCMVCVRKRVLRDLWYQRIGSRHCAKENIGHGDGGCLLLTQRI